MSPTAAPETFRPAVRSAAPLSRYAQLKKIRFFLDPIPTDAAVLEIGSGSGWVGESLRSRGVTGFVGMDLFPPADIVGDIKKWRELGLQPESFDFIIAFEVIEHVDLVPECFDLLKPGGKLLLTSPVPSKDWVLKTLETIGMTQKRTSPHSNLVDFRRLPLFEMVDYRQKAGLSQWGVLRKPVGVPPAVEVTTHVPRRTSDAGQRVGSPTA